MNLIILSNHISSTAVLAHFQMQGYLRAVVSTDKLKAQHLGIEDFCIQRNIRFLKIGRRDMSSVLEQLFTEIRPDAVIMFGFSYRISRSVFEFPPLGFFNVHFSLLPAYKGPDPLFWQMKNGEKNGGVSIHKVDEGFDTGGVVLQNTLPFIPGETWGIADDRHSRLAVDMIVKLVEHLSSGKPVEELAVEGNVASYDHRAEASDVAIDWAVQNAEQVEALVNACNPGAGGAVTVFRQQLVKILEVSPVDASGDPAISGGTVIHADASGLYVQCVGGKILRINILKLNEGFITGSKMVAMGVKQGEKFENGLFEYHEIQSKLINKS